MAKQISGEAWIYWTYNVMSRELYHLSSGSKFHPEVVKYILSKGTKNEEGKYVDSKGQMYQGQEIN